MSTIAIFRKAKMGQKSSINHVVNSQSLDNTGKLIYLMKLKMILLVKNI